MPNWQQVDADVAEHGLPGYLLLIIVAAALITCFSLVSDRWLAVSALPPTGSTFLIWFGPTPRLAVADPDLIREILLSRAEHFDRYESHPMVRQLEGEGLVSLRGEKWAHHRRVLAPTFHMDNLKVSQSPGPPTSSPK
jgi:cytochrome P450